MAWAEIARNNSDYENYYENSIRLNIRTGCSMKKVKLVTKGTSKIWWDSIYNVKDYQLRYETYVNNNSAGFDNDLLDINSFDPHLWEEFTFVLEGMRQEIYNAMIDYGASDVDAHFLSVKFAISTIKKFRGKMCSAFNVDESRENYHKTFFRPCLILLRERLESMTPKKAYLYSKKATETNAYRKQAARLCAEQLEEETAVIITSRLMI